MEIKNYDRRNIIDGSVIVGAPNIRLLIFIESIDLTKSPVLIPVAKTFFLAKPHDSEKYVNFHTYC